MSFLRFCGCHVAPYVGDIVAADCILVDVQDAEHPDP
jgi:hypothetical protein